MNAEQLYKNVLQQMANEGNIEAKTVLMLGATCAAEDDGNSAVMRQNVAASLEQAQKDLGQAIRFNEKEWTRDTDVYIERARSAITTALVAMTK
jgi:predicted double-glycine peptidase